MFSEFILILPYYLSFSAMTEPNCVFCNIINKTAPATIAYENDELIIFNDIKPAAKFHFLVVPKTHINNVKELTSRDVNLVRTLVKHGKDILSNNGCAENESLFGFHWPPFNSVSHLHLHAICSVNDMNFLNRMIFKPNSFWFVTPEYVLSRLESQTTTIPTGNND